MPTKTKKTEATRAPAFAKLPAELQIMIFHEALRKPQIHFVNAERLEIRPGNERARSIWSLCLTPKDKSGDTSGYRLFDNIEDLGLFSGAAAEVVRKNTLQLHILPLFSPRSNSLWAIDAATDLVVLEFGADKSGKVRFWHPNNRIFSFTSIMDIVGIRDQLKGIRRVAFVYGANQQPDAASSESAFQCLQHHHGKHANWKFCPEELLGFIYQLSSVEAVYFILKNRVNSKAVMEYAKNYFSGELSFFGTHLLFPY